MLYIDDEFCLYLSVLKAGFHKHFRKIKPLFTTKQSSPDCHQYIKRKSVKIREIRVKYDS